MRLLTNGLTGIASVFFITMPLAHAAEAPFGLWVWSAQQQPASVSLAIEEDDGDWRATVDGQSAPIAVNNGTVTITAPDEERFVGALSADGTTLRGQWVQPYSSTGYGEMITLVDMQQGVSSAWRAEFDIQARPFRVFLDIFEDDEGDVAAVIRNPERNDILRATTFRIEQGDNNQWTLISGSGDYERRHLVEQVGDDELKLGYSRFDEPLSLRPATPEDAKYYFPRAPENAPVTFTPPAELNDGWEVASPAQAGFDPAAFDALAAELSQTDPRDRRPRLVHAVLVAQGDKLVFEEYFYGHDRSQRHDSRSLGKVFAPVLIGALKQQSADIDAQDRPIADVLASAGETLENLDKAKITLAHLMTFSSGLDCNVNGDSLGSEDAMWDQQQEKNFWLYTARLPLLHPPGERYAYCSGSINLTGSAIRQAGGKPIIDLFDELIAKPLSFGPYHWNIAPDGAAYLGGGAYMRPRDLLKIGVLHANGGAWQGKQIISSDWIEESTSAKIDITPHTTGMTEEEFNNSYFGGAQAYEWRVDEVRTADATYASYEATGNGGQVLVVVPELDLTVLFMGGNYRMGGIWGRWRNEIIGGHLIPGMAAGSKD